MTSTHSSFAESSCLSQSDKRLIRELEERGTHLLSAPDPIAERILLEDRISSFASIKWAAPGCKWPPSHNIRPTTLPLPEISKEQFNSTVLRDAMFEYGGLIVRDFIVENHIGSLKSKIDASFQARHKQALQPADNKEASPWYATPEPDSRASSLFKGPAQFSRTGQAPSASAGSMWVVHSPRTANHLIGNYRQWQLDQILRDYFQEPAVLTTRKWVLRIAPPRPGEEAGWHQDGRFMGENIRTINMWLPLTDCGGSYSAPGIEIMASSERKIHETGTRGAWFDWTVGPDLVDELSQKSPVLCPEFRAGDALFFDHYNLHRTGLSEHHTESRYAIESWFFAASHAPAKQGPLIF